MLWVDKLLRSNSYYDNLNNKVTLIMSALSPYKKAIQRAESQAGVQFGLRQEGGHLWIGGIEFAPTSKTELFRNKKSENGILIQDLSTEERTYCQTHEISYLTVRGELFLIRKGYRIVLEPSQKAPRLNRSGKPRVATNLTATLSPTALVSPNGLAILDTLFRIGADSVQSYKSALSFAREFDLVQPKLSQMMTKLRAKTLADLKLAIKALPDDWWSVALHYPMTRKGFTPFFENAKSYHSLLPSSGLLKLNQSLHEWQKSHSSIVSGPVEVMRELGLIRDPDIYLWGTESAFHELKKEFRLIPGIDSEKITWNLATPFAGFDRESILSAIQTAVVDFKFPSLQPNLFRAIWDLSFGDERLKEVQLPALRRILNEV